MPVRIVRQESHSKPVETELLIQTVETNRDRVRTLCDMLLTTSGILISVCLAFLLWFVDKGVIELRVAAALGISILLFLISSSLSIFSSTLRNRFLILDEAQFVEDLIGLLNSEVKISRISFALLLVGTLCMVGAVFLFILVQWR